MNIPEKFGRMLASNYLAMALRFAIMIILTREMFLLLPKEAYGFWAMLWSVFGYSVLLDLGFGTSAQKLTSEVIVHQNWKAYNIKISSIITCYLAIACLVIVISLLLASHLDTLFAFSGTGNETYRQAFIIFGVGTALAFPVGIFVEVLRGAHLMHERNNIEVMRELLNATLIILALHHNQGVKTLAIIAVGTQCLANLLMYIRARQLLPQLSIHWLHFDRSTLKGLLSFSLVAYIITLSNLMIFRTDQIVISVMAGVAAVAYFHVANRLAEMFRLISSQVHDILAPLAATLSAMNNENNAKTLLLTTLRYITLLVTLMCMPAFTYISELLHAWLELDHRATTISAQILLVNTAFLVIFRNTANQILLMSGHHVTLMRLGVAECLLNLVLSCLLIGPLGITGVAIGTLLPNLFIGLFFNVPLACRFTGINITDFFLRVGKVTAIGTVPFLITHTVFIALGITMPLLAEILVVSGCAACLSLMLFYHLAMPLTEQRILVKYCKSVTRFLPNSWQKRGQHAH